MMTLGRISVDDVEVPPGTSGGTSYFCASEVKMDSGEDINAQEEIVADQIDLSGGTVDSVEADYVRVTQGGANRIVAGDVDLKNGAAIQVYGDKVALDNAVSGIIQANDVSTQGGGAGVVMGDRVQLTNARTGVTIGRSVISENSSSILLLAQEVNGTVETVLDTRGALLAGLISGIAVGLVLFVGNLLARRR